MNENSFWLRLACGGLAILIILFIIILAELNSLVTITKHTNRLQVDLTNKYNCEVEYYMGENSEAKIKK
jgi:hypothetical protein